MTKRVQYTGSLSTLITLYAHPTRRLAAHSALRLWGGPNPTTCPFLGIFTEVIAHKAYKAQESPVWRSRYRRRKIAQAASVVHFLFRRARSPREFIQRGRDLGSRHEGTVILSIHSLRDRREQGYPRLLLVN